MRGLSHAQLQAEGEMLANNPTNSPKTPSKNFQAHTSGFSVNRLDGTFSINTTGRYTGLPEVAEEIRSTKEQSNPEFENSNPISGQTLPERAPQLSRNGGGYGGHISCNYRRPRKRSIHAEPNKNYKTTRPSTEQLKVDISRGSRGLLSGKVTQLVEEFSKSTRKYWDGEDGISGFGKQLECMRGFIRNIITREMDYRGL